MKANFYAKIITFVCVFVLMFSLSASFAEDDYTKGSNSYTSTTTVGGKTTFQKINTSTAGVDEGTKKTANTILGFVQFIGYAIAVGMLIYVGIKYVMASADEKANLKNSLIRYVIGAVLIAGASAVSGWIFKLGESM